MLVEQCALMHIFRKQPGCVLIGACALIRMNTIFSLPEYMIHKKLSWPGVCLSILVALETRRVTTIQDGYPATEITVGYRTVHKPS